MEFLFQFSEELVHFFFLSVTPPHGLIYLKALVDHLCEAEKKQRKNAIEFSVGSVLCLRVELQLRACCRNGGIFKCKKYAAMEFGNSEETFSLGLFRFILQDIDEHSWLQPIASTSGILWTWKEKEACGRQGKRNCWIVITFQMNTPIWSLTYNSVMCRFIRCTLLALVMTCVLLYGGRLVIALLCMAWDAWRRNNGGLSRLGPLVVQHLLVSWLAYAGRPERTNPRKSNALECWLASLHFCGYETAFWCAYPCYQVWHNYSSLYLLLAVHFRNDLTDLYTSPTAKEMCRLVVEQARLSSCLLGHELVSAIGSHSFTHCFGRMLQEV